MLRLVGRIAAQDCVAPFGIGVAVLVEYRFFRLNAAGLVDSAERLRLANEAAALDHARGFGDGDAVEVWQGGKRIASVPPTRRRA